jgi:subtilisin family serine protease
MNGLTTPATIGAVIAASKGIIVCSSAGNEGSSTWHYISSPADADSILTNGAVNPDGTLASFSSRGPTADGRIKPDVVAQGALVAIVNPGNGAITSGGGTSFSNPIIAGMTACLWQAHPDKTNMQIINAIKQSASFNQFPNNDYGWGIPNYALADLILTGLNMQNFDADSQPIIFPNPMHDNATIVYNAVSNGSIMLSYYDMLGRLLRQQSYTVSKGVNQVFPDLSNISAGSYIIRIDANESSKIVRLVKI